MKVPGETVRIHEKRNPERCLRLLQQYLRRELTVCLDQIPPFSCSHSGTRDFMKPLVRYIKAGGSLRAAIMERPVTEITSLGRDSTLHEGSRGHGKLH